MPSPEAPAKAASPEPRGESDAPAPEVDEKKGAPPPRDMEDPDRRKTKREDAVPPVDPKPGEATTLLTIEQGSPAGRGGKVAQSVGLELPGDRFAPTLSSGCALPCWQPIPMWPKDPTETTVDFTLFRGKGPTTSGATKLGRYRVSSVPKAEPGSHSEVVVGLGIVDGSIVAHAKLRATGAALPLAAAP